MKMLVGICEDDPFTRATLEASLSFEDFTVVFSEGLPADALVAVEKHRPHAVLVDLHLGDGPNGLDLAKRIRSLRPETGLVFLTSFESPKLLIRNFSGLPTGSQYLQKNKISSVAEIASALQRSVQKIEATPFLNQSAILDLTQNQLDILELLALGKTNQEIAKRTECDVRSVEATITRIAKKLGLGKDQGVNQRVHMARTYLRAIGGLHDQE
jgi:DNA-binding NarL/FixJ family response regulator